MGLLDGKVCFVTGAGRGIGEETVRRFAEEGAIVYGTDLINGSMDESFGKFCTQYKTEVIPMYFDVTDETASKSAIMQIKREQGRLDVLVNNAGIMQDNVIGMISYELMKKVFDVNVFAVLQITQLAAKLMMRQRSGSIVNISSIVGSEGSAGQTVYSASKGAVAAMTKAASKELSPYGIRVNAVAPGLINTDLFRAIGEKKIQENLSHVRMGRLGEPIDVANVITFLASDMSAYVTGEIIGVDGETHV